MTATMHRAIAPAALTLQPIDDAARAGGYQLVFGAGQFAVSKWDGTAWRCSSGKPLPFEPEGYRP